MELSAPGWCSSASSVRRLERKGGRGEWGKGGHSTNNYLASGDILFSKADIEVSRRYQRINSVACQIATDWPGSVYVCDMVSTRWIDLCACEDPDSWYNLCHRSVLCDLCTGVIEAADYLYHVLIINTGVDLSRLFGGNVVRTAKCMGVSRFWGECAPGLPLNSTPMIISKTIDVRGSSETQLGNCELWRPCMLIAQTC